MAQTRPFDPYASSAGQSPLLLGAQARVRPGNGRRKKSSLARIGLATLAALVLVGGWFAASRQQLVQDMVFERWANARYATPSLFALAPQGMVITPCGTGPSTCMVIAHNGRLLLVDPGREAPGILQEMGVSLAGLDGVLLTRLDPSAIDGLGAVRIASWADGRKSPLRVDGPNGIESIVNGLNLAYEMPDALERVRLGARVAPFTAAILQANTLPDNLALTSAFGDLSVVGIATQGGQALYRVTLGARSAVFAGQGWSSPVFAPLANRADIAVMTAQSPELELRLAQAAQARGATHFAERHQALARQAQLTPAQAAAQVAKAGARAAVILGAPGPSTNTMFDGLFLKGLPSGQAISLRPGQALELRPDNAHKRHQFG